jgi:hypothetical protein
MTRTIRRLYVASGGHYYSETVIAECDDGTLWKLGHYSETPHFRWRKLPPIPQDEDDEDQA